MIRVHLSRLLGDRRISQIRLSEMTKVHVNTVNAMYNERLKRIDLGVLSRICQALQCQPGDLLEFVSDENRRGDT